MSRLPPVLVLFTTIWLITACSPRELPSNYQFFSPFIEKQSLQINHTLYRYPTKREFQFFDGSIPIDLTTIWRWNRHCPDLSLLASKRNNQLGKTMVSSQQFLYEIKVLNQLDHCIQTVHQLEPDDPALKEDALKLQRIHQQKLTDSWTMMVATLWNDDSVRFYLKGDNTPIDVEEIQSGESFKNWRTLTKISDRVLQQEFTDIANMELENILYEVQQRNSGGITIRHLQIQLSILDNKKTMLANACQAHPQSEVGKQWQQFYQLAVQTQIIAKQMFSPMEAWLNQSSLPTTISSYWQGVLDLMMDHQVALSRFSASSTISAPSAHSSPVSTELDVCSTHSADSV